MCLTKSSLSKVVHLVRNDELVQTLTVRVSVIRPIQISRCAFVTVLRYILQIGAFFMPLFDVFTAKQNILLECVHWFELVVVLSVVDSSRSSPTFSFGCSTGCSSV